MSIQCVLQRGVNVLSFNLTLAFITISILSTESRAITITTFAKDRVQELVSDTNSPLDEYETTDETQYFSQVQMAYIHSIIILIIYTDSTVDDFICQSLLLLRPYVINPRCACAARVTTWLLNTVTS